MSQDLDSKDLLDETHNYQTKQSGSEISDTSEEGPGQTRKPTKKDKNSANKKAEKVLKKNS